MDRIRPIPALAFPAPEDGDLSSRIAPPYDVLDESSKQALLDRDSQNIVKVDLPHLPPKTVGPDETYEAAGEQFQQWIDEGVLEARPAAYYVYEQQYEVDGESYARRGLIANVRVQPFGDSPVGEGGVYPHEETFSSPKEDRLKLMRATEAQLSPIFGLYSDPDQAIGGRIAAATEGDPTFTGVTDNDGVEHRLWAVEDADAMAALSDQLQSAAIFIADGHHRYTTAINYRDELADAEGIGPDHPAEWCMFVLVAMEDPGMVVLPTHRVLGSMSDFSVAALQEAAAGALEIQPADVADLAELEASLPDHGPHAMGLYTPGDESGTFWIATTVSDDPLAADHGEQCDAWRQLDVAILQHLVVEKICEPTFSDGASVDWKFPHDLDQVEAIADGEKYPLGVILQPTPLEAVKAVSEAGQRMPQKSTFFYPKVATGFAINPLAPRHHPEAGS
ncbi:MAG: DUF1015 domain-containing protein [Phycisphaeraceae bacterium]|nr:DUF1015 domain-containing protein [Phycisphaeraceae bacterium]